VNNQELNRFNTNAEVDERTLREIYFPAFEAAVQQGQVLTVMGAYNNFRGQYCCHNEYLLQQVLKKEWGFPGLVVSDWAGTHDTDEAVRNGLDIEMGTNGEYDEYYLARAFLEGIQSGVYAEALLDEKVRRILDVMSQTGMLDENRKTGARNTPEHQRIAKEIARESIVLLKNDNGLLPMNATAMKSILVVGDNADRKMAMGGGSSEVKALYEVTPLEGIRQLVGNDVEINYIKGYPVRDIPVLPIAVEHLTIADQKAGTRGWNAAFYLTEDFSDDPVVQRIDEQIDFSWEYDSPAGDISSESWYSVRWTGTLMVPVTGTYRFGAYNTNELKMYLDGELLFGTDQNNIACYSEASVFLDAGRAVELTYEYYYRKASARVEIGWLPPGETVPCVTETYRLVTDAAERADAVIFVGGLNHQYDAEARDRVDMHLPDGQDGLLSAVLNVNPNTAVVMISGSPVEMPWVDQAKTLVWSSYAGMEGGTALAEVLFGRVNPSGKLAMTLPKKLADSPAHAIGEYTADTCHYTEGLLVGYRYYDTKDVDPLFEFGRGLSYTEFAYSNLLIKTAEEDPLETVVSFTVKNTGTRDGAEVTQLYLEDPECSVIRPKKELKGFVKVFLSAGEEQTVFISLSRRDLSFYDVTRQAWHMEPGNFVVHIGSSSRDIRLSETFSSSGGDVVTSSAVTREANMPPG